MGNNDSITNSGEGTRPATAGGVDNIGGASGFTPGKKVPEGGGAPAPREKMREKRQEADSANTATHPDPRSTD